MTPGKPVQHLFGLKEESAPRLRIGMADTVLYRQALVDLDVEPPACLRLHKHFFDIGPRGVYAHCAVGATITNLLLYQMRSEVR